jgi:hypothetical protein
MTRDVTSHGIGFIRPISEIFGDGREEEIDNKCALVFLQQG